MIFGMLNLEKWHERLTDLSTSPVIFRHFSLVNPGKKSFSTELCYSKNKQVDVFGTQCSSLCLLFYMKLITHRMTIREADAAVGRRVRQVRSGIQSQSPRKGIWGRGLRRKPTIFCKLYCRRVGNYFSNWALWRYNTIRYDELHWLALKKRQKQK